MGSTPSQSQRSCPVVALAAWWVLSGSSSFPRHSPSSVSCLTHPCSVFQGASKPFHASSLLTHPKPSKGDALKPPWGCPGCSPIKAPGRYPSFSGQSHSAALVQNSRDHAPTLKNPHVNRVSCSRPQHTSQPSSAPSKAGGK